MGIGVHVLSGTRDQTLRHQEGAGLVFQLVEGFAGGEIQKVNLSLMFRKCRLKDLHIPGCKYHFVAKFDT
ncbi:hypothetical protein E2C01_028111 [Portunus trituberculatus]|uniref:Uncharacterized protein n=1 Tax=Portunus trituberculatus TaxID=210409 RepID=A0A5B7EKH7_PORTR|nr:hypothetical protein [Portunus trituberculatus]